MVMIYMLTGIAAYVAARIGWSLAGTAHRNAVTRSSTRRHHGARERAALTERLGVPRRGGTRSADR